MDFCLYLWGHWSVTFNYRRLCDLSIEEKIPICKKIYGKLRNLPGHCIFPTFHGMVKREIDYLTGKESWKGLKVIGKVESIRKIILHDRPNTSLFWSIGPIFTPFIWSHWSPYCCRNTLSKCVLWFSKVTFPSAGLKSPLDLSFYSRFSSSPYAA